MQQNKQPAMAENKMGVMPVNKLLISMSVPMMISMVVQALYNVVDSIFVAQISEKALTAVSLAFPVQNLMIALAVGTGVGINALVSRRLGEKNYEAANSTADNGIFLNAVHFLSVPGVGPVLRPALFLIPNEGCRNHRLRNRLSASHLRLLDRNIYASQHGTLAAIDWQNLVHDGDPSDRRHPEHHPRSDLHLRLVRRSGDGHKRRCDRNRDRTDSRGFAWRSFSTSVSIRKSAYRLKGSARICIRSKKSIRSAAHRF